VTETQKGLQYLALALVLSSIIVSIALVSAAGSVSSALSQGTISLSGPTAKPGTLSASATPKPEVTATPAPAKLDLSGAPLEGKADAKVTVVEFSDFQCPFCRRYYTTSYQQIKTQYIDTGKVNYAFMHFPLESIHPASKVSAQAAVCAQEQDKFWEMHSAMFDAEQKIDPSGGTVDYGEPQILNWSKSIDGLNVTKLQSCIDSGQADDKIQSDLNQGISNGINGTPGFIILGPNGKRTVVSGAQPFSAFQTAIDSMLAA